MRIIRSLNQLINEIIRKLFRIIRSQISRLKYSYKQISYSQSGEDIIVNSILSQLNIIAPVYIDIGAHHPKFLSNTYLFYRKGFKGICVEPDPEMYRLLQKKRRKDICLNIGIGERAEFLEYFIFSSKTLNTFSKETAIQINEKENYRIVGTMMIEVKTINEVIDDYLGGECPNFISIDVEGSDFEIISSFDFKKWRPEVFCIETLTFSEIKNERKLTSILDFMKSKDYLLYADTYINTIFVDSLAWDRRN